MNLWEETFKMGNQVRELKTKKASKEEITAAVEKLKALKAQYEAESGQKYDANKKPAGGAAPSVPTTPPAKAGNQARVSHVNLKSISL